MLAVSIVTYRTPSDELSHALDCLKSKRMGRIDIVDNGSERRIEELCASRHNVAYTPSENRGYGAGHNISLRRSLADKEIRYHLVMNSDVDFDPADLDKLIGYMDSHPEVGALQPRLVDPWGDDTYSARMLPTPADLFVRRFLPSGFMKKSRDRYLLKHLDHSRAFNVHYIQGSFMLLRVDTLRHTGLFDERFFMYPEDIDLSRRIAERADVVYFPGVKVTHLHRAASYNSLRLMMVHCINMARYFNKWGWFRDRARSVANKKLINQTYRNG